MHSEQLAFKEIARRYGINDRLLRNWERIYLEEGPDGLYVERRGRGSKNRPPKLSKQVEEDLIAENQRLRAELAYLKKLQIFLTQIVQAIKRACCLCNAGGKPFSLALMRLLL